MDFSFHLINYIQSRIAAKANKIELYIADNMEPNRAEIIIKDTGLKLVDSNASELDRLVGYVEEFKGSYRFLFHRGENTLLMEWAVTSDSHKSLENLHSILGFTIINNPQININFSYLSSKGEYFLDSSKFHRTFSSDELMEKELLVYMNELLADHLNDVRDLL